jgi:hypothetical protein
MSDRTAGDAGRGGSGSSSPDGAESRMDEQRRDTSEGRAGMDESSARHGAGAGGWQGMLEGESRRDPGEHGEVL